MANRLATATSPYLLQHKDNPVHWQPWDDAALRDARDNDRPILLSVGYAACHWCHVMAHESFEHHGIADLMNDSFVSIKVDREERPDLDHIYQQALALLGQQGGWPLTMFLTPAGEPFWGGTYFPPEDRYGRPGFPKVLETVGRIWRDDREKITANTTALRDALQGLASPAPGSPLSADVPVQTARRIAQAFDTVHGGLAGAPKFPQAPILRLLWQEGLRYRDPGLRHAVLHTLRRMSQGGIYDHLGGGYARYSVDDHWLVPHFEKMLYDNALLLNLLSDAWSDTHEPLFEARVRETIGWLEREMLTSDGFASSLDADSEGEEGRFYVWTAAEIDRLLGDAAPAFRLAFGVTDTGNWEGTSILNRLHQVGLADDDEERSLRRSADILLAAREQRVRPGRDDKILADWNALTVTALARAAAVFEEPAWLALARRVYERVCRNMGSGGRLVHSYRAGRRLELAFLEDYALMAEAALALYSQTADRAYLEQAEGWVGILNEDFIDLEAGGYHQTPRQAENVLVRPKSGADGPSPAGNAVLLGVLARLFHLTGAPRYREQADNVAQTFAGEVRRNPAGYPTLLANLVHLHAALQIVVIGGRESDEFRRLWQVAVAAPAPWAIVSPVASDAALPHGHPAAGKDPGGAPAAAFVCQGETCQLPTVSPEALRAQVADLALA